MLTAGIMALLVLVAGCTTRVGYVGRNVPGHMSASYNTFTGSEQMKVAAGEGSTLSIDYRSEVTKGELAILVKNPDGTTLQKLETDTEGSTTIELTRPGPYYIAVIADGAGGDYDIRWEIETPEG
jgi:hypothetical protein